MIPTVLVYLLAWVTGVVAPRLFYKVLPSKSKSAVHLALVTFLTVVCAGIELYLFRSGHRHYGLLLLTAALLLGSSAFLRTFHRQSTWRYPALVLFLLAATYLVGSEQGSPVVAAIFFCIGGVFVWAEIIWKRPVISLSNALLVAIGIALQILISPLWKQNFTTGQPRPGPGAATDYTVAIIAATGLLTAFILGYFIQKNKSSSC